MLRSVVHNLTPLIALHVLLCYLSTSAQEYVPEQSLEGSLRTLDKLRETRDGLMSLQKVLLEIDQDLQRQQQTACSSPFGGTNCLSTSNSYGDMNFQDWLQGRYYAARTHHMTAPNKRSRQPLVINKRLPSPSKRRNWNIACALQGANNQGASSCHLTDPSTNQHRSKFLDSNLSPGKRDVLSNLIGQSPKLSIGSSLGDIDRKRRGLEILKRILSEMDTDLIVEQKRMCRINLGGHCATESAAAVADQWHYLNSPLSPGKRKRRDLLQSTQNNAWQILNRHAKSGRKPQQTLLSKLIQVETAK